MFPVPTLMSSVLVVPCSPQTWHCGTQEMWRSPSSVTFMLGLALHHPGDMEVHLLSIPTFTSPVPSVPHPPWISKATCWTAATQCHPREGTQVHSPKPWRTPYYLGG